MNRSASHIVEEMKQTGIMMCSVMTKEEREKQLLAFQDLILNKVFNEDHAENLRLCDVISHFRSLAKEKGLESNGIVLSAIRDLETVSYEIGSAKSGNRGESEIGKTLRYIERPIHILANVPLQDGDTETELDYVVITSSGVLILEVKNNRNKLIISEKGQLCFENGKPVSKKKVLGERMNVKRYLLKKKLEEALEKAGAPLSLYLESRVVFSHPEADVVDKYFYEQFCYNADLPHEIDAFESDVRYSDAEMQLLEDLISSVATMEVLQHVEKLDFDRIRRNFAEALILLEEDSEMTKCREDREPLKTSAAKENTEAESAGMNVSEKACERETATNMVYAILSGFIAACGVTVVKLLFQRKGV